MMTYNKLLIILFIIIEIIFIVPYKANVEGLINNASSNSETMNILNNELSLYSNSEFRGRVASIFINKDNDGSWSGNYKGDLNRIMLLKNDYRGISMLKYGVPTLFEYNQMNNPLLYHFVRNYLSNQQDIQDKNILNISKINIKFLKELGVTHLITNNKITEDNLIFKSQEEKSNEKVFLYKISDPIFYLEKVNLYDNMYVTDSFEDIVDVDHKFAHLKKTIVSFATPNYVKLNINRYGFRINAKSTDNSFILLPIQFSNCLAFKVSKNIKLVRVNFIMTGFILNGEIDDNIKLEVGLLNNQLCKNKDYYDSKNFLSYLSL
jgi:hypothetical protein